MKGIFELAGPVRHAVSGLIRCGIALLCLFYLQPVHAAGCEIGTDIEPNQWYLITAPCVAPEGSTMEDLAGSSSEWSAYTYDTSVAAPAYKELLATDPIPPPGTGFWFIAPNDFIPLGMPAGSSLVSDLAICDEQKQNLCYKQSLPTATTWNLVGNPLAERVKYSEIRVEHPWSADCSGTGGCTLPEVSSDIAPQLWRYDTDSYTKFDGGEVADWTGYWATFGEEPEANPVDSVDTPTWDLYTPVGEDTNKTIFVTTGNYDGNLGGVAGADNKCTVEAALKGLYGTYRAYLRTGGTGLNAYSPEGNWSNLDTPFVNEAGELVADNRLELTTQPHDNPIAPFATEVFTGYDFLGSALTCASWTSNATFLNDTTLGWPNFTTNNTWRSAEHRGCHVPTRLMCVEQFPVDLDPDSQHVFVTDETWNGNLGGISGGNAKCEAEATDKELSGSYLAWLSTSSYSPATNWPQPTTKYISYHTGLTVANDWGDLTDAALINQISPRGTIPLPHKTWTGTSPTGNSGSHNCANWSTNSPNSLGSNGFPGNTNHGWTTTNSLEACNNPNHLYCFEQP